MTVCIIFLEELLYGVVELLGQCCLFRHKIVAEFLTKILKVLLLSHKLLFFFLQTLLLTFSTFTTKECIRFHFSLKIKYIFLEALHLFLKRFGFCIQFDHRLLILALQFV